MMRATKFEFEYRFWVIAAIYGAGFLLFRRDVNAVAAVQHLLAPGLTFSRNFERGVIGLGACLIFLAAALRTWASAYLRSSVVHDTAQHSEALVADGPFRFTRNPLYLANLPMALGIGLLATRAGLVFMVLANLLFVYRLIGREEEALRETQGESYRAYCQAVPRFWPAWQARVPASGAEPRWLQALGGESFIWLFGIAEFTLALTLSAKVGVAIFVAGFVVHLISNRLLRTASRS